MPSGGLHLFLGPDRPNKLARVQAFERALTIQPLDRHHIDGTAVSAATLLALCRQSPAASPLRLVVIDQAHRLDHACAGALVSHAAAIAQSACVILLFEGEVSLRHPFAQAQIPVATERFPGRDAPAAKPFALTDALSTRDAAAALTAVRDQLLHGKEPLELLGLVAWQLSRWLTVRRLAEAGYTTQRIASIAGLKLWQAERLKADVAGRTLDSLRRLLARCWQLDVDAKSGRALAELAIEELIVAICLPPQLTAPASA